MRHFGYCSWNTNAICPRGSESKYLAGIGLDWTLGSKINTNKTKKKHEQKKENTRKKSKICHLVLWVPQTKDKRKPVRSKAQALRGALHQVGHASDRLPEFPSKTQEVPAYPTSLSNCGSPYIPPPPPLPPPPIC